MKKLIPLREMEENFRLVSKRGLKSYLTSEGELKKISGDTSYAGKDNRDFCKYPKWFKEESSCEKSHSDMRKTIDYEQCRPEKTDQSCSQETDMIKKKDFNDNP